MSFHAKPVMPQGFTCASKNCGIKKEGNDLSLFYSEAEANAAAVFTQNQFPGAPVKVGREILRKGKLRAIVVNSKVSNVGTGEEGVKNARRMGAAAAKELGVPTDEVIMSSTGVIGKPLPVELIEAGVAGMKTLLAPDPMVGALGIMTTDTKPKALSMSVGNATLAIVGKGSGMIEPNMATMLVYIFTDAAIPSKTLDGMLREAVKDSFNMLSVDTDTSTSDTCVILANGLAGNVDAKAFQTALNEICVGMTKLLARDGEGATKLLVTHVEGAKNEAEARKIAKSLVNSPLVKTMAYGADPNVGRIMMAVGKCFDCEVVQSKIEASISGKLVYWNESRVDFDEAEVRKLLSGELVEISVNLNVGGGSATAYGCDLTEGYIKENAAYYSS
jgi:glutamate N-acetyltransferase/amino-acid N-acetyltransferase